MPERNEPAPIIVKRKKVAGGDGHHGGAWKVAYADFVTAMMAFLMLMWLLNATTEKQRKGIADYFNPTIPVNRVSGGGEGMFGGDSVFAEETRPQNGTGGSRDKPSAQRQARGDRGTATTGERRDNRAEDRRLAEIQSKFEATSGESDVADELLKHIRTRVTDEGLIVELFDLPGEPLFETDGDTPTRLGRDLVAMVAEVFSVTANTIAVGGHTRSYPPMLKTDPRWSLSTRRADRVRRLLIEAGLSASRMQRVVGWADRKADPADPMAVQNNRVELILLRSDMRDGR